MIIFNGKTASLDGKVYQKVTPENLACCDNCALYSKCSNEDFSRCCEINGTTTIFKELFQYRAKSNKGESITFKAENDWEAKHWIINHMDCSQVWTFEMEY